MPKIARDELCLLHNQMHHGCGSAYNSSNRWFDKILQVIVGPDGHVGFNYEHSTAEGPPIITLADYILKKAYALSH
jgi:carnitine O-acetyltransferase